MKAEKLLERITLNPNVMTGKPVIKGTRLTVQFILGLLAHGASVEEILAEYKGINTGRYTGLFTVCNGIPRKHHIYAFDCRGLLNAVPCG
ncbi:MAG TPA: DUF433 domain-containing protein [Candidatus Methanoperedens sp.]